MKKMISVLVCFAMLLSFAAVASAEKVQQDATPTIRITYTTFKGSYAWNVNSWGIQNRGGILIEIVDYDDFSYCELVFDRGKYVWLDSVKRTNAIGDGCSAVASCDVDYGKSSSDPLLRVTMGRAPKNADSTFAQLVLYTFEATGASLFCPTLESAALYTADGEIENVNIEIVDNTDQVPELYVRVVPGYSNLYADDPQAEMKQYVCFNFLIGSCPDFESFEMLVTYNPEVLDYTGDYPFYDTADVKKNTKVTVLEPGKAKITGSTPRGNCHERFNSICFEVISEGATNVEVSLVSWKNADGEIENGKFEASICNFTAVPYSEIEPLIATPTAVFATPKGITWQIPENMTVAAFAETAPTDLFEIYDKNGKKLGADDTIGTGCVYELNCYDQYTVSCRFVIKNDLSGDGVVSAEDARLALRISVGLDEAAPEQLYAVSAERQSDFNASLARTILRTAVGLK